MREVDRRLTKLEQAQQQTPSGAALDAPTRVVIYDLESGRPLEPVIGQAATRIWLPDNGRAVIAAEGGAG